MNDNDGLFNLSILWSASNSTILNSNERVSNHSCLYRSRVTLLALDTFSGIRSRQLKSSINIHWKGDINIHYPHHLSHDMTKPNKVTVCPAKTQISLGILIRVFAGPPRLIRVFAGRTLVLLVLSCRGSFFFVKTIRGIYMIKP